jgi:hypothetical protein
MPFTISHVAAVVPFTRPLARARIFSAAVIGSMVPDFGYFMPIQPPRFETHSLPALLTFCLPVGMLAYWFFQLVMKEPLLNVLPDQAYMRWLSSAQPASWRSARQWLLAACGVLAGAVTHLAWDTFTHEGSRGVRMVPELSDPMVEVHGHLVSGAHLLQDLSSLAGFLFVIAAVAYALRGGSRTPVVTRRFSAFERNSWVLAYVIAAVVCYSLFLNLEVRYGPNPWIGPSTVAVALLRGLLLASISISVLMQGYLLTKRTIR